MGNFDDFLKRNNLTPKTTANITHIDPSAEDGGIPKQALNGQKATQPTLNQSQTVQNSQSSGGFDRFLQRNGLIARPWADIGRITPSSNGTPSGLDQELHPKIPTQQEQPVFGKGLMAANAALGLHQNDDRFNPYSPQNQQKDLNDLNTTLVQPTQELYSVLSDYTETGVSTFGTEEGYNAYIAKLDSLIKLADETDALGASRVQLEQIRSNLQKIKEYAQYRRDNMVATQSANETIQACWDLQKEIADLETVQAEYEELQKQVQTLPPSQTTAQTNRMAQIRQQYGDIEATLSQKRAQLATLTRAREANRLSTVVNNDDFNNYSTYVSTESQGFWDNLWSQYGMGYDDLTYEYINGASNGMRQKIRNKAVAFSSDTDTESAGRWTIYDFMTNDEIGIYNYYYAKEGKASAERYLNSIQDSLNYRQAIKMYGNMQGNIPLELAFGVVAGVDQFKSGVHNFLKSGVRNFLTPDHDYIPVSPTQIASGMVREDLSNTGPKLPEWLGGASVGQTAYDAVTTTSNMLPSIMLSTYIGAFNPAAGQIAGTALMGASAAGNAYQEMLNLGYSKGQARAYSTLVGGSEAGLQYLFGGIRKLGRTLTGNAVAKLVSGIDNAFARIAIEFGSDMLSEGMEEGLQEILTPWFQNLALHAGEDVNWSQVAYSTLLGALTAGGMNVGNLSNAPASIQKVHAAVQSEYNKRIQAATKDGSTLSAEAQASIYQSVVADLAAGKLEGYEMSAADMAEAYNDYQRYLSTHQAAANSTPTVQHTASTHSGADVHPTPSTTAAPAENSVLSSAVSTVQQGGTVSNSMAERILSDPRAMETLVQKTGLTLPQTMSAQRAAVKAAVTQLANQPAVDTAPQTGYDNQNTTGGATYGTGEEALSSDPGGTGEITARGRHSASGANGSRPGVSRTASSFGETVVWAASGAGSLTDSQRRFSPEDYITAKPGSLQEQLQRDTLADYGIKSHIIKKTAWDKKSPAFARSGEIFICETQNGDNFVEAISHELTHVMKQTGFQPYLDFIETTPDHIDLQSPATHKLLRDVAVHRGIDLFSMDDGQVQTLYDELNAAVYGAYKSGQLENADNRALLESVFPNLDAYLNKLDSIFSQFKSRNTTPSLPTAPDGVNATPTPSVGAAESNFSGKAAYNDLLYEGNVQPDRPGDVRPMEIPKTDAYGRQVSEFAANAYGAEVTPDHAADQIQELIAMGALGFDTKTNQQMLDEAAAEIKAKGMAASEKAVNKAVFSGRAKDGDIAKAMLLYAAYANRESQSAQDRAAELMVDLATMANDAGRRLQLFGLLRKLTPQGQLTAVQKSVQRAVDKINKNRSKNNQAEVEIPQDLVDDYLDAAERDIQEHSEESAKEKEEVERAIYKAVAAQIKASPMEKLNAWRYMAMLGNVKTNFRNFMGNAAFHPMVNTKRTLGAMMEAAFVEQDKRTKAVLGVGKESRELMRWAQADAKTQTAQDMLSYCAQTGDAARTQIDENRQIYDTKWLENVRKLVQAVPEAADMLFKRREYSVSLASFLKARGYTAADLSSGSVSQDVLIEARNYAAQEALKATFNDHNAVSDFLANLRYKGDNSFGKAVNILAEGVLPFRRTPANILVRGLEYSPLHLLKSVTYDIAKVRSGEMTGAQYIDGLASGISGTAAMMLGYALCSGMFGIRLRGKVDDEDEKRQGHQAYALEIGGKSYTIDWLAPVNLPFFVGANLYESTHGQTDAGWFASAVDVVKDTLEPMLELSCLSSLNDLIESAKYAEDGTTLWTLAASAATSYLNQYIPTLFGQIEQATEGSKNSVYSNADTALGRFVQKTVGRFTQRIPGVDLYQAQKYDPWGRPVETSSWAEALLSPSYVSDISNDPVDKEISRLNKAQSKNVSPSLPSKTLTVDAKTVRLSADQYETLCRTQGENQRRLVEGIVETEAYKTLSDEDKAAVISKAYDYARELSKPSIGIDGKVPAYIRNRPEGMSEAEAIIRHVVTDGKGEKHANLPVDVAAIIAETIGNLPKETKPDGTTANVRPIQQMEAIVANDELDPYVEMILPAYMEQAQQQKYQQALDKGYDSDEYVAGYRLYLDRDKEQSKTRQIQQMAEELDMDFHTAKILWEIYS